MNADRLLALYDRLADAPDAIPCLRQFVLDLAVRGRLVKQDPADEPASELLKRIVAEKARLVEAGELNEPRKAVDIKRNALQFVPAEHWEWVRLIDISRPIYGFAFNSSQFNVHKRGMPLIRIRDISKTDTEAYYEGTFDSDYLVRAGDYLVGMDGAFNLRRWQGPDGLLNQRVMRINNWRCGVVSEYAKLPLQMVLDHVHGDTSQTTVKHLSAKQVNGIEIPLPPLAEQHRIVAKVDELMALCDRLETMRVAREETRNRLVTASLARLSAPDADAATFRTHARFAVDALPALTARTDQIKHLRRTILDLAVRGKLVEQYPADEPASELLKRIAAEKARLVKAGEVRKPKATILLNHGEIPFPLPTSWAWTQIAEIGLLSPRNDFPDDHLASFVPMSMIPARYGATSLHEPRSWSSIKKGYTHFAEGDVGLAKITPCFENGKSVVFRNLTGGIGSGTTELHVVRPVFVDADYIVLFLKSRHFIETGIPRMTGTAGQKRVATAYFANSAFPLPPLAEQHRIVAKVDELMALCDRLESSLKAADTGRQRLLESLLREALEPTPVKSGKHGDFGVVGANGRTTPPTSTPSVPDARPGEAPGPPRSPSRP